MINLEDRETWPEQGSQWQHTTGRIYSVLMYANVENDPKRDRYPVIIIYRNTQNDAVYCRRLDDWERSFVLVEHIPTF